MSAREEELASDRRAGGRYAPVAHFVRLRGHENVCQVHGHDFRHDVVDAHADVPALFRPRQEILPGFFVLGRRAGGPGRVRSAGHVKRQVIKRGVFSKWNSPEKGLRPGRRA